jgi:hypothetical protein
MNAAAAATTPLSTSNIQTVPGPRRLQSAMNVVTPRKIKIER